MHRRRKLDQRPPGEIVIIVASIAVLVFVAFVLAWPA